MISYWYRLLHGRFKLWQLLALGTMWIAGGVALQIILSDLGGMGFGPGLLFYGSGALHFWFAHKALKEQRALEAIDDRVAAREARLERERAVPSAKPGAQEHLPPLPSPPRIGDDPFRNPPHSPIIVERPGSAAIAVPAIAGESNESPKILT